MIKKIITIIVCILLFIILAGVLAALLRTEPTEKEVDSSSLLFEVGYLDSFGNKIDNYGNYSIFTNVLVSVDGLRIEHSDESICYQLYLYDKKSNYIGNLFFPTFDGIYEDFSFELLQDPEFISYERMSETAFVRIQFFYEPDLETGDLKLLTDEDAEYLRENVSLIYGG